MGKQFIALFCGRIEAHRIIYTVIRAEGDLLIAAIDRTGAGIDQVLNRMVPASLQNVVESNHVGLDIGIGVLNRVTDAGLGGQVHDDIKLILGKELLN